VLDPLPVGSLVFTSTEGGDTCQSPRHHLFVWRATTGSYLPTCCLCVRRLGQVCHS
jgi:hypothetical protein